MKLEFYLQKLCLFHFSNIKPNFSMPFHFPFVSPLNIKSHILKFAKIVGVLYESVSIYLMWNHPLMFEVMYPSGS